VIEDSTSKNLTVLILNIAKSDYYIVYVYDDMIFNTYLYLNWNDNGIIKNGIKSVDKVTDFLVPSNKGYFLVKVWSSF